MNLSFSNLDVHMKAEEVKQDVQLGGMTIMWGIEANIHKWTAGVMTSVMRVTNKLL